MCDCKFDPDPDSDDENTPETAWHYRRTCLGCGGTWWGLHCPHDNYQNPCPHCGIAPLGVVVGVDFGGSDMTTWSSFYRLSDGRIVRDLLDALDPNYPMLKLDHIDFGDRE